MFGVRFQRGPDAPLVYGFYSHEDIKNKFVLISGNLNKLAPLPISACPWSPANCPATAWQRTHHKLQGGMFTVCSQLQTDDLPRDLQTSNSYVNIFRNDRCLPQLDTACFMISKVTMISNVTIQTNNNLHIRLLCKAAKVISGIPWYMFLYC